MNTTCPQCGSNQTQPLDVIYSSGTSRGSATTQSFGTDFQGNFAHSAGITSYGSSTLLASRVAPPKRPVYPAASWFFAVLSLGAGWFLNTVTESSKRSGGDYKSVEGLATICWVVGASLILYAIIKIINANSDTPLYEEEFSKWSQSRFCFSCSNKYIFQNKFSNNQTSNKNFSSIKIQDNIVKFSKEFDFRPVGYVYLALNGKDLDFAGKLPLEITLPYGNYVFNIKVGNDSQTGEFLVSKIEEKPVETLPQEMLETVDRLKKAGDLLKDGLISKEDFNKIKDKLIG